VCWISTLTTACSKQAFCTNHRAPPGIESHLLEEIALANQWISKERLLQEAKTLAKTGYG